LSLFVGLICHLLSFDAHGQVKYTLTEIFPNLKADSYAEGINAQGDVVGSYGWASNPMLRPYFYHAGVAHDLLKSQPPLGGYYPVGVNNYGLSVGHIEGSVAYGYMAYRNQFMQISEDYSWPVGLNQNGHITGGGGSSAWIWIYFKMYLLPLGPFEGVYPAGINIRDQVVGSGELGPLGSRTFLYSGGKLVNLGLPVGAYQSWGTAINDSGEITGYASGVSTPPHTFVYDGNGSMHFIDAPYFTSEPSAINNSGQIVGWFFPTSTSAQVPFIYDGHQIQDLSKAFPTNSDWSFGSYLGQMAINDAGQIVGTGVHNGFRRAYLLTPVR